MASARFSDDYPGFLERPPHLGDCTGFPISCCCGVDEMWAIVSPATPISAKTGKWLIFPGEINARVDSLWAQIASSTEDGRLGFCAKIKISDRSNCAIMVYTADCDDSADVEKIKGELRALLETTGLKASPSDQLKYKSDEATQAQVYSTAGLARRGGQGVVASLAHPSMYMEGRAGRPDSERGLLRVAGGAGQPWAVHPAGSGAIAGGGRGPALCRNVGLPGGCRFGDRCRFSHGGGSGSGGYGGSSGGGGSYY